MPSPRTKWIVTLGALPLVVIVLELVLRATGFEARPETAPIICWNAAEDEHLRRDDGLHRFDAESLWSPRPGAVVVPGGAERINAGGYRGPLLDAERSSGVQRVALLGESTSFGLSVPWRWTAAGQLQGLFERRGSASASIEVLNAGVAGHTALQGLARWRSLVRSHRPDVVFAAFGANNEALPCGDKTDAEKLAEARAGPSSWRRAWEGLLGECRVLQLALWLGRSDAESPAAEPRDAADEDAALRVAGQPDWPGRRRVSPDEFDVALVQLAREVRQAGARLVLVSLPRRPGVEHQAPVLVLYSQRIADVAAREGLELLDLRVVAREWAARHEANMNALFQPDDGWHLSPAGHALFAEKLAACLVEEPGGGSR